MTIDTPRHPRNPFDLDRMVHEPARLGVLTILTQHHEADFLFLQNVLGLTKGNLSSHMSKLAAAGLIRVTKTVEGNLSRTVQAITPAGRDALARYWQQVDTIRDMGGRPSPRRNS